MSKVSEAQKKASRAYENRNREKTRVNTYRRTARLFVKLYANEEDMKELINIYNENKKDWNYYKIIDEITLSVIWSIILFLFT